MVRWLTWLAFLLAFCAFSIAEEPNSPSAQITLQHRYWDRENTLLFAVHGGLEAADFGLTHRALAHGGVELNPLARPFTNLGTAGQITFFAGGTAAAVGISYWLHRRGHHRLERLVSIYAIADSGSGVIHNATHPPNLSVTSPGIR
jgi:hypothetical protein